MILTRSERYSNPLPIAGAFREDTAFEYIRTLHPTARELLNLLIWYRSKNTFVCPSQEKLASHLGVSRRQVNRIINKLVSDGVIGKYYRHCKSSYYNINMLLFVHKDTRLLKDFLPNLYYISQDTSKIVTPRNANKKVPYIGLFWAREGSDVSQTKLKGLNTTIINHYTTQHNTPLVSLLNCAREGRKSVEALRWGADTVTDSTYKSGTFGNSSGAECGVWGGEDKKSGEGELLYVYNTDDNQPHDKINNLSSQTSTQTLSSIVDDPGDRNGSSDKTSQVVDAPMDKLAQFEMLRAQLTQESIEMAKRKVIGGYGDVYS